MVQDVKLGDVEAARKIQTYVRALQQGVTNCPLVQRSLDIITNSLQSPHPHLTPREENSNTGHESLMSRNYLPAFPYRDMQVEYSQAQIGTMNLDAFSMLDNFPENHLDSVTGEWYMPS